MLPPQTLDDLAYHWGDAYLLSYARDRWAALRRDRLYFITADTLYELEAAIQADYGSNPVPRDFDPPGATDYLDEPDDADGWELVLADTDAAVEQYSNKALDPETRPGEAAGVIEAAEAILRQPAADPLPLEELRASFPAWDIHFSVQLHAWIARRHRTTICENSAVLLRTALTLIERQQHTAGPGRDWPPGPPPR